MNVVQTLLHFPVLKATTFAQSLICLAGGGFALRNSSVIGAVAGTCLGLLERLNNGQADSFRLYKVASPPFKIGLFNAISRGMGLYMHTGLKYIPITLTLVSLGYTAIKRAGTVNRLWTNMRSPQGKQAMGKVAKAIGIAGVATALALTKEFWAPPLALFLGKDPSGHVLMITALGTSLSLLGEVAADHHLEKTEKMINLFSVAGGIGNGVMIFQTTRYHHTVNELFGGYVVTNLIQRLFS